MLTFAINLFRQSDGVIRASFPDIPMAVAYGRTMHEAYEKAVEALREALDRYVVAGFELPVARATGDQFVRVEEPRLLVPA